MRVEDDAKRISINGVKFNSETQPNESSYINAVSEAFPSNTEEILVPELMFLCYYDKLEFFRWHVGVLSAAARANGGLY